MILDQQLLFDDGVTAKTTVGANPSQNVIDLGAFTGARGRNIGSGSSLYVGIVFTAQAGSATPTCIVSVQAAVDAAFSTYTAGTYPASPFTVLSSRTLNLSAGILNRLFLLDVSPIVPTMLSNVTGGATGAMTEFFRLNFQLAGTSPSINVKAFLLIDAEVLPQTAVAVEYL